MREVRARLAGNSVEPHEREDLLHPGQGLLLALPLPAEEDAREPDPCTEMAAGENILGDGEFVEQGRRLERANEAQRGNGMGRHARDVAPGVDHASTRRPVEAGDHVEGRGLAGAVRSDEPVDRTLLHVEGEVVDRRQAAESPRQSLDVQHDRPPPHGPPLPRMGCRRSLSFGAPGMSAGGSLHCPGRTIPHANHVIKWHASLPQMPAHDARQHPLRHGMDRRLDRHTDSDASEAGSQARNGRTAQKVKVRHHPPLGRFAWGEEACDSPERAT